MSVHFVTHLKVEKVEIRGAAPKTFIDTRPSSERQSREVSEVGSVTVKARSLEELTKKIAGHLALFDEEPVE